MGYRRSLAVAASCSIATLSAISSSVEAQEPDARYAAEPSAGMNLPTAGLAGQPDALSVSTNPCQPGLPRRLGAGAGPRHRRAGRGRGDLAGPRLRHVRGRRAGRRRAAQPGLGLRARVPAPAARRDCPGSRHAHAPHPGAGRAAGPDCARLFLASLLRQPGQPRRRLDTFDFGLSGQYGAYFAAATVVRDRERAGWGAPP